MKAITTLLLTATLALAQGPEVPPGPPGPTQKSLQDLWDDWQSTKASITNQGTTLSGVNTEVFGLREDVDAFSTQVNNIENRIINQPTEPRTPLGTTAPLTITESGSYYLTGNLVADNSDGIVIDASRVTLDLNGFTISTTSTDYEGPTRTAIAVGTRSQVTIRNGNILGAFAYGIHGTSANSHSLVASDIIASGCGIRFASTRSRISRCLVQASLNTGDVGIEGGVIELCVCESRGVAIKGVTVLQSRGRSFTNDGTSIAGILASESVVDSYGESGYGHGIWSDGGVAQSQGKSTVIAGGGTGILAIGSIVNSIGESEGGIGVYSATSVANSLGTSESLLPGIQSNGPIVSSVGKAHYGSAGIQAYGDVSDCTGESFFGHGIFSLKNVNSSSGESVAAAGIRAWGNVGTSTGISEADHGIHSDGSVSDSTGTSTAVVVGGGTGIKAAIVQNSKGSSVTLHGIEADVSVTNSWGISSGSSSIGDGIKAVRVVSESHGFSENGDGIDARIIVNSDGDGGSGAGDVDLRATTANGCLSNGGATAITHKYNMP